MKILRKVLMLIATTQICAPEEVAIRHPAVAPELNASEKQFNKDYEIVSSYLKKKGIIDYEVHESMLSKESHLIIKDLESMFNKLMQNQDLIYEDVKENTGVKSQAAILYGFIKALHSIPTSFSIIKIKDDRSYIELRNKIKSTIDKSSYDCLKQLLHEGCSDEFAVINALECYFGSYKLAGYGEKILLLNQAKHNQSWEDVKPRILALTR